MLPEMFTGGFKIYYHGCELKGVYPKKYIDNGWTDYMKCDSNGRVIKLEWWK